MASLMEDLRKDNLTLRSDIETLQQRLLQNQVAEKCFIVFRSANHEHYEVWVMMSSSDIVVSSGGGMLGRGSSCKSGSSTISLNLNLVRTNLLSNVELYRE